MSGAPASAGAPRLEVKGLAKSFGSVRVLAGVDLDVRAGEVHALLGMNGAGKSTLTRIVLGEERADAGAMRLGGAPYAPRGPRDAQRAGVVLVPQERTLCAHLSVVDNVVLGVEPGGPLRRDTRRARELASRALSLASADASRVPLDARAGDLSVADQQVVEIARALAQGSDPSGEGLTVRLLVLDEPTSSLTQRDAAALFERVRALREAGIAILLVTHFFADVRAHADRYTVLRDGKVAGQGSARDVATETLVAEVLGPELARVTAAVGTAPRTVAGGAGEVLLEARDVAGHARPTRASLTVRRGEVLGIAGLVGSGRTELLRILAGLDRPRAGVVTRSAPRGVGLLSEDRAGEGLMLRRSIAENVWLSPRAPRFAWPRALRDEGARWIDRLRIRAEVADQLAGELSGGNQQKVQIARLLREDFDVLLVDEPTRGIDVASKAQVLGLLRELAAAGKGVVLVSSQLDELVATCDFVAVLRRGVLEAPRPATDFSEASLLLEAAS